MAVDTKSPSDPGNRFQVRGASSKPGDLDPSVGKSEVDLEVHRIVEGRLTMERMLAAGWDKAENRPAAVGWDFEEERPLLSSTARKQMRSQLTLDIRDYTNRLNDAAA